MIRPYKILCLASLLLCACAPGRADSIAEGIGGQAAEIGHEIEHGAEETGRVAKGVGEDVVAWAKGEDTTDMHELTGTNSPRNQQEHERQMAALCNSSQTKIHALREKGWSWNAIAKNCGLDTSPSGKPVWQYWD